MSERRIADVYLNLGHVVDHLLMLIYPTVLLAMSKEVVGSYGEALTLSLGGFVAFGACSLPAGWLGDRWSRHAMMVLFFLGIGGASVLTGLARSPVEIAIGLTLVGVFAAVYHPVGIAMLVSNRENVGAALGINGVAGNLGVALAALVAAGLADLIHWRASFIVPGVVAMAIGIGFAVMVRRPAAEAGNARRVPGTGGPAHSVAVIRRVFLVLMAATIFGGLIFNATTVAMPKLFAERLQALVGTTFGIGVMVSAVYVLAAVAQLCVGYVIDRRGLRALLIAIAACQVPFLFLAGTAQGWAMLFVAIAMMFVIFGQIPINDAVVARYTDEHWRSRVYALRYVASFGASALAVPLVAYLHESTGGFARTFSVLSVFAFGTLVASFCLPGGGTAATETGRLGARPS
jgi:MFS family permease